MDDEADELVEVVVATGTGLSWDIPGKAEGVLVSHSTPLEEGEKCNVVNWDCPGDKFLEM